MTLLITGATGHVGGALVRLADAAGQEAVALYRGDRPAGTGTRWAACDLNNPDALSQLSDRHNITTCIHTAAVSNEAYARPDPFGAVTTNIAATASLLETARRHKWRRFILVSTGSVFQKRPTIGEPILEDALPEPENVYSTTKLAAEMLCRMYRTEYDLSASTVRLSWVYGPPIIADDATRGPIPSLLMRALRGEPVDEGGADFAASFTYIDDAAAGLLAAAATDTLSSPVYHLGPGLNIPLGDVAAAITRSIPDASIALSSGTDPWTRFTALRDPLAGDQLQADTGFTPQYSITDGIAAYAAWLDANRSLWQAA
jgi:nucleoside-diphosphate-sugar epimerase